MLVIRKAVLTASLLLLASCERNAVDDAGGPPPRAHPVVVYAAYPDSAYLPAFVDAYQQQTGTTVIVRNGEPLAIVDDVISGHISPPADVLITPGVAGVWRAAEEGALRPLQSALVNDSVASWLRDPDEYWTAWSYRQALIAYDPGRVDGRALQEFRSLAEPRFKGRLCLASSADSISLAVIALLIDELGVGDAELMVRGWVANLAIPPLATDSDVMAAIEAGDCAIGIVSSATVRADAARNADTVLEVHEPASLYVDIEGLGIARHARNPDGARALIEWLLEKSQQDQHAADVYAAAARTAASGPANVSRVAMRREDALKLAERARYR